MKLMLLFINRLKFIRNGVFCIIGSDCVNSESIGDLLKNKLKVIQFGDSFTPVIDGVTVAMMNYAKWINQKYGSCEIVVPHYDETEPDDFDYNVYRFKSIDSIIKRPYRIGVPALDRNFMIKLKSLDANLVHAHSPYIAGDLAYKTAKRLNIPLVATFHTKFYDDFYACTHSKLITKYAVSKAVNFFEKADYVWAVSHSAKDTLYEYGYRGKVEIMPNGCDTISETANRDLLLNEINNKYGLKENERIFLFVGRMDWHKNIRIIIDATEKFFKTHTGKLVMIGEGMNDSEIHDYVKRLGLYDKVIFTGKILDRDMLFAFYLRSHLLLFPSLYDTLALVVREAASVDCPAVLVRGSGAAEGCIDEKTAFLCENSADSLLAKMQESISDTDLYNTVKKNCHTIAVPWEKIVDRVANRYDKIIDDSKKGVIGDVR